ncbi:hypothetical protein ACIA58_06155 [Kribbella sp. NPDC051586]|uniref:hypothetical protein n=1 Tax=Kribbella sp. NPDC051586 TaxID=3364118 RepID=UPI0037AD6686
MAQSDPEPEPAPDPEAAPAVEPEPGTTTESEADVNADSGDEAKADSDSEVEESPEAKQQRTIHRFLWTCSWLTALAGVFLISGMTQSHRSYNGFAWLGAVVAVLCLLALIAGYVACARGRLTLRTRLLGPLDVFQTSTLVMVVAVICGLLAPSSNSSALALLFPWALTYWMYGLDRTKTPAS